MTIVGLLSFFYGLIGNICKDRQKKRNKQENGKKKKHLPKSTINLYVFRTQICNGSLTQTGLEGGVEIWEGTGDICVTYPKNYYGPKMTFTSSGGSVQIQYFK